MKFDSFRRFISSCNCINLPVSTNTIISYPPFRHYHLPLSPFSHPPTPRRRRPRNPHPSQSPTISASTPPPLYHSHYPSPQNKTSPSPALTPVRPHQPAGLTLGTLPHPNMIQRAMARRTLRSTSLADERYLRSVTCRIHTFWRGATKTYVVPLTMQSRISEVIAPGECCRHLRRPVLEKKGEVRAEFRKRRTLHRYTANKCQEQQLMRLALYR